jgi:hypothetical protein
MSGDGDSHGVFDAGNQSEQLRVHGIAPAARVLLSLNGKLPPRKRSGLVEDDVRHL